MRGERLLVIAAGGTGGHMFPAQALAQEMLRRGWRVSLSTDERGMRYAGGYPEAVTRRQVAAATLARGGIADKLKAPLRIAAGVREALAWFAEDRPAAVAGFGGYPSLPALTAAWRMGLPRLIHEQNGVLGRVNKVFATRVHALACGVEPVLNAPAGAPLVLVGNPIRDAARAAAGAAYAAPEPGGEIRALVIGGSQGARIFAERVPPAFAGLSEALRGRLRLSQQVRAENFQEVREIYAAAGIQAELSSFFDDVPARMAGAHLVISRAGASSVAELAALGRPALLVPFAAATADHQTANARALTEAGAALSFSEAEAAPEVLRRALEALFAAPERLAAMAAAARGLGRPDAASALADLVERVASGGPAPA
ncbi:MAG: undecaprenyldiphospho-muramoylpentapeptide beta-N-acetylglucosaminyltransferase [Pseudomonadota bacterium]